MAIEAGSLSSRFSDVARVLWALDDLSLQAPLASAVEDVAYQETVRSRLPRFKRRASKEPE